MKTLENISVAAVAVAILTFGIYFVVATKDMILY
jgi:uncharacterized protein YoxC